ncbi:hypothetical protein JCM10213_004919 [Rhodosporidiobolus nylandii]
MQALLPAVTGQASLSLANLASHTHREGLAPRRTVQLFLQDQRAVQGQYLLRPPPSDEFDGIDTSTFPPHLSPGRKRKVREDDSEAGTALVLHSFQEGQGGSRATPVAKKGEPFAKKKPSLVAAMRPRLSSAATGSSPVTAPENKGVLRVAADDDVGAAQASGSSSILVPRAEQTEKVDHRRTRLPTQPAQDAHAAMEEERDDGDKADQKGQGAAEKGKGKAEEKGKRKGKAREKGKAKAKDEPQKLSKSALAKKGKLRAEAVDEDEKQEVEERLRARRERRANKAFIRKDRSQSAAAVGAAAASKLKKTKKRGAGDDSSTADDDSQGEKAKKMKRRGSAAQESRSMLQELQRPGNIGGGRLTLKPSGKAGIFNNGKASARTKVGHQLPDLAFSELNFLNGPRRSPPAPSSPRSSSSLENLPPPISLHQTKLPRIYGSKSKPRRSSTKPLPATDEGAEQQSEPGLRSPPHKAKTTAVEATTTKKSGRRVFSHVEIPVRRTSSSASLSSLPLPRSLAQAKKTPVPSRLTAAAPSSETNDSVLSAASLARRKAQRATEQRVPLHTSRGELQPMLRAAAASVEQVAPSYGGGFEAPFQPQDELPPAVLESSEIGTASLQRIIDAACEPVVDQGQLQREERRASSFEFGSTAVAQSSEQPCASPLDGAFIYLRPPLPAALAAVDTAGEVDEASRTPSLREPHISSGSFADETGEEAYGAAMDVDGERAEAALDAAFSLAPGVDARYPFPSSDHPAGGGGTFPTISSASFATSSALPAAASSVPWPAFFDPGDSIVGASSFLRRGERAAGFGVADGDLQDEGAFREAMRKQWPRTRC